jgi:molybdopterin/thiamine biosynthesis adenylyltransferase
MSMVRPDRTALVVGVGSLGGPAALALAAGGVGRLVLVDGAAVEPADLAGQPIFGEADLGKPRAQAAARRLSSHFPRLVVEAVGGPLDAELALGLARAADVVVDGSNHLPTMFLVNDAAAAARKPLVQGGILLFTAQLLSVVPGATACLRCLFEAPPPPRPEGAGPEPGVLGPLAGLAGSLLAAEALRLLAGLPGAYAGRLLVYEARSARSRVVPVKARPGCLGCGGAAAEAAPAQPAAVSP